MTFSCFQTWTDFLNQHKFFLQVTADFPNSAYLDFGAISGSLMELVNLLFTYSETISLEVHNPSNHYRSVSTARTLHSCFDSRKKFTYHLHYQLSFITMNYKNLDVSWIDKIFLHFTSPFPHTAYLNYSVIISDSQVISVSLTELVNLHLTYRETISLEVYNPSN